MSGHFSSQQGGHGEEPEKAPKPPSTGERQFLPVEWNGAEWLPLLTPFDATASLTRAGVEALLTAGTNLFLGENALKSNIGIKNTAIGHLASDLNGAGEGNTSLGYAALLNNVLGNQSTAVGAAALQSQNGNGFNTAVGFECATAMETGVACVAMGTLTLKSVKTGNAITALGTQAMEKATSASECTAVGCESQLQNLTGIENTTLGYVSLQENKTGKANTAIGTAALRLNKESNNTAVGADAGYEATGEGSIFLGFKAGYKDAASNKLHIANNETTDWITGAASGKEIAFCGKAPIEPHAAPHTETTKALWEHLEALGLA